MANSFGHNFPNGCSNVDVPGFLDDRPGLEIDYGHQGEPLVYREIIRDISPRAIAWRERLGVK